MFTSGGGGDGEGLGGQVSVYSSPGSSSELHCVLGVFGVTWWKPSGACVFVVGGVVPSTFTYSYFDSSFSKTIPFYGNIEAELGRFP